jgi:CRP-like cAMP-binding protein
MAEDDDRTRRIVAALQGVPLFQGLPEADLAALAQQVVRRRVARNDVIVAQGDPGDGLYVVASGLVGISRQSSEGDELLLTLCEPGDYFGDLALIDGAPRSATATAFEDGVLLLLPRRAFRRVLEAHPVALWRLMEALAALVRRLTDTADDIALVDVRRRLAHRLLRLADQGLIAQEGNPTSGIRRPVRITQQQLANMTGATRESVNKQLQAFAAEGLITLEQGRVCIRDRAALKACGDSGV